MLVASMLSTSCRAVALKASPAKDKFQKSEDLPFFAEKPELQDSGALPKTAAAGINKTSNNIVTVNRNKSKCSTFPLL